MSNNLDFKIYNLYNAKVRTEVQLKYTLIYGEKYGIIR